MLCESSMYKHQLMWDQKLQSWRLVFAVLPGSGDTPPTFYNVTWKKYEDGKWRTMSLNTPLYTSLFKDLRARKPRTESLHIQLHSSDFAYLSLGKLKWLIEFPPAWRWFLSWIPGICPGILFTHHSQDIELVHLQPLVDSHLAQPQHTAWQAHQLLEHHPLSRCHHQARLRLQHHRQLFSQ